MEKFSTKSVTDSNKFLSLIIIFFLFAFSNICWSQTLLGNNALLSLGGDIGPYIEFKNTSKPSAALGYNWRIYNMTGTYGNSLQFFNYNQSYNVGSQVMTLTDSGKMGLGVMIPTAKLHVVGDFKLVDGSQGAGKILTSDVNGNASWQTPTSGGGVGVWTNLGSNHIGNTNIGNVGIGTNNPTAKLDVTGTFKLTDGSQGVGKVLTSDSNGNASWQNIASSTGGGWTSGNNGNLYSSNTGNIGIGTASPITKLHLSSSSFTDFIGASNGNITISSPSYVADNYKAIDFMVSDNYVTPSVRIAAKHSGNGSSLVFGTSNDYSVGITNKAMSINPSGKVFISNPSSPNFLGNQLGTMVLSSNYVSDNYTSIDFLYDQNHTIPTARIASKHTNGGSSLVFGTSNNYGVGITNKAMSIDPSGTVAIEGKLLASNIRVAVPGTANWSDYVFAPEYKLQPLEQVEAFIKENKHLPNVPSAAQMVKEGNDLGATDAKLLEKIEELTLYLIQQNKRIEEMQKVNQEIEKENRVMRQKLEVQNIKISQLEDKLNK